MADALPAKVQRKLWRGDSRTWTHVFTTGDPAEPVDLTGHTFTAQFRVDKNRGEVVCESVCAVTEPGVVVETLTSVEADKLPGEVEGEDAPRVYWDLQSVDGDGERHTWLYADVQVKGDRTHG